MYVLGNIEDSETVMVDIGTGFYAEKVTATVSNEEPFNIVADLYCSSSLYPMPKNILIEKLRWLPEK